MPTPNKVGGEAEADSQSPSSHDAATARSDHSRTLMQAAEFHVGPIPSPAVIRGYGETDSSFPERIFKEFEEEAALRRQLERDHLEAVIADNNASRIEARWGQILAFFSGITALLISGWVTTAGYPTAGGVIGGTTVVGLVSVFILGRTVDRQSHRRTKLLRSDERSRE